MKWISRLERRFGDYGVPNVTVALIVGQVLVYCLTQTRPAAVANLALVPTLVLEGQVWRVLTFLFVPPVTNLVFAFFIWYLLFLMGTALENYWGIFRYNLFLLIGWLATVAISFIMPGALVGNGFIQLSVFLAFAFLNPDFVLYIAFVFPVRIVWLAVLTWLGLLYTIAVADWGARLGALASILNFLLFFGDDIFQLARHGRRHMARQARAFSTQDSRPAFYHRCTVCGITDQSHPNMDFRYCSKCEGTYGYCTDHLKNHEHVRATPAVPS
jgi:hypothetical protein